MSYYQAALSFGSEITQWNNLKKLDLYQQNRIRSNIQFMKKSQFVCLFSCESHLKIFVVSYVRRWGNFQRKGHVHEFTFANHCERSTNENNWCPKMDFEM